MRTRLLIALLFLTAPLLAQTPSTAKCALSDTPSDCFHRFVPKLPEVAASSAKEAQSQVNNANSGLTTLVSSSGSAVNDFLSRLVGSLQTSSLSQNGQTWTFDWDPNLGKDGQLKLQTVLVDPKVSSQVSTALASNPAAVTALNDDLTATDDVTFSLSWSLVSRTYGRSIDPHRDVFSTLLAGVMPDTAATDDAMFVALQGAGITTSSFNTKFQDMAAGDQTKQLAALNAVEAASRNGQLALDAATALTHSFAKMLHNQPQIYVSGMITNRTAVVGPNEIIAKGTFEYGFRNLHNFFRTYRSTCDEITLTAASAPQCATMLEKYAGDTGGPDAGSDSGRLAISVEYHKADANKVDLPQYSVNLSTKAGHSLIAELTYGRTIAPRPDRKSGRIDVAVSYQDIQNAAAIPSISNPSGDVKDQFLASITYTQKISDTVSFPISLVYANHASYLPSVDRKLNANFGIQYKMPSQ